MMAGVLLALMNPRLPKPHNHVPEVSPNDGWADAVGSVPDSSRAPQVLPPRRSPTDRMADAPTSSPDGASTGLRIDLKVIRTQPSQSPQKIEVQEIKSDIVRLDQMAPTPQKVARQATFHERPIREKDQSNSSGESSTWGATQKLPKLWIIGSGAGILVIVILVMALLPMINSLNTRKNSGSSTGATPLTEEKIDHADALDLMLTKQPEAVQLFRAYITATQVDDVIPLIGNGKALEETVRSRWVPVGVSKRWSPSLECTWSLKKIGGRPYGLLQGILPNQSPFVAYFTNDDNRLLLDWKATSGFSTATFAELEKNAGDPAEVRGEISLAPFYTSTWPEADYQSFRLTSPDGQDIIWCYSRRGEPPHEALAPFFRRDQIIVQTTDSWKITLRLAHGPTGTLPNQWLIGEMLHIDWVTP